MRKKMFISMVAVLLSASLVGCGSVASSSSSSQLTHNFATEWSNNASKHWHACLDNGCKEKSDEAAHTLVANAAKSVASTCTVAGKTVEVCSVCAYEKETTLEKTEHQFVAYPAGTVAATHDTAGVTAEKCSICNEIKETPVPALGHDLVKVEGATVKNVDNKDVVKYTCSCGKSAYGIAVLDYSFLTEGSQAFNLGNIPAADAAEAGEGVRIVGAGSMKFKMPIQVAGRYRISIGANPAPSGIGNPNIEAKNGVKVNGVDVALIPSGPYSGLGLVLGQFNELVLADFDATVTAAGEDVEIEITQVASQRLFFGGELKITQIPAVEPVIE